MRRTWALPIAIACGVALAAPTLAAVVIPPTALVAHPRDLPGFSGAKHSIRSAISAIDYARIVLEDGQAEAQTEALHLATEGFQEGMTESFKGSHGEAVSDALVFSSARGAKQELLTNVSESLRAHHGGRFTVGSIPGSVGFNSFVTGHLGASADVLFATGRCYVEVGDAVPTASTGAIGARAPIAGATALYRRVKHLCA